MNTKSRNVRLQEHVVFFTVMEHAEDLIKKNGFVYQLTGIEG